MISQDSTESIRREELQHAILDAIENLDEATRVAIVLRQLEGLTVDETAKVMDTTPEDVERFEEDATRRILESAGIQAIEDAVDSLKGKPIRDVETREVVEAVTQLSPDLIAYLKKHTQDLDKLPGTVFEQLVAEFLKQRGFEDVKWVGRDVSTSADVFAAHRIEAVDCPVRYFSLKL